MKKFRITLITERIIEFESDKSYDQITNFIGNAKQNNQIVCLHKIAINPDHIMTIEQVGE